MFAAHVVVITLTVEIVLLKLLNVGTKLCFVKTTIKVL